MCGVVPSLWASVTGGMRGSVGAGAVKGNPPPNTAALRSAPRARRDLRRAALRRKKSAASREDISDVTINRAVVEGKKPPLIRKKQDKDAA